MKLRRKEMFYANVDIVHQRLIISSQHLIHDTHPSLNQRQPLVRCRQWALNSSPSHTSALWQYANKNRHNKNINIWFVHIYVPKYTYHAHYGNWCWCIEGNKRLHGRRYRNENSQTKSYSSVEELVISIISEMNISIDQTTWIRMSYTHTNHNILLTVRR